MPDLPVTPPADANATPTTPAVSTDDAVASVNPNPAQPAPSPKESLKQGFVRGMGGEGYAVDAQGNMTNTRVTAPSGRGKFGSILAGALMGALSGMQAARPGGIPSAEIGGGVGAGAKAADEAIQKRDLQRKQQAQGNYERQQQVKQATNEDLRYKADLHMKDLQNIQLTRALNNAEIDDPIHHQELKNALTVSNLNLENSVKDLGLINERTYAHYAEVPQSDISKFARSQVKIMAMPDGTVKVWDRTFDSRTTPNSNDFAIRDLASLDKDGKPTWRTIGTVKAGQGTAAQQESQWDKEHKQLADMAKQNADVSKSQAEAEKAMADSELARATAANMKNLGVTVPNNFKVPENVFGMDSDSLRQSITSQGATVPGDFPTLYAVGHYKADLGTFVKQIRARGGQGMTQAQAQDYVRTFINPNYDQNNFGVVKKLQEEFASTKAGTAGGNILAFNTAVDHLGRLSDAAIALHNHDLRLANAALQELGYQTGKAEPQVFDNIALALAGEQGKVQEGKAPDKDVVLTLKKEILSKASSPEALNGVIKSSADLMLSRAGENANRYVSLTGELPADYISPSAARVYQKLGINWQRIVPNGAAQSVGTTGAGGAGKAAPESARLPGGGSPQVPAPIAQALANKEPGHKYKFGNGETWMKAADGTITLVTPQAR